VDSLPHLLKSTISRKMASKANSRGLHQFLFLSTVVAAASTDRIAEPASRLIPAAAEEAALPMEPRPMVLARELKPPGMAPRMEDFWLDNIFDRLLGVMSFSVTCLPRTPSAAGATMLISEDAEDSFIPAKLEMELTTLPSLSPRNVFSMLIPPAAVLAPLPKRPARLPSTPLSATFFARLRTDPAPPISDVPFEMMLPRMLGTTPDTAFETPASVSPRVEAALLIRSGLIKPFTESSKLNAIEIKFDGLLIMHLRFLLKTDILNLATRRN
jgi:hypothetical protein